MGSRALRYVSYFINLNSASTLRGLLLALLLITGITFRKNSFWQACAIYLLVYFLAISKHTYFLPRNLVVLLPVVATLAGYGFWGIVTGSATNYPTSLFTTMTGVRVGVAGIIFIILASTSAISLSSRVHGHYANLFPEKSMGLNDVSLFIADQMLEAHSCMVVGTFNGLSKPWMNLLWLRSGGNTMKQLLPPEPYYRP